MHVMSVGESRECVQLCDCRHNLIGCITPRACMQGIKQSVCLSSVATKIASSRYVGVRTNRRCCQTRQKSASLYASNRRDASGSLQISSFVFTTPIDHTYV